jgi:hypothetical protein
MQKVFRKIWSKVFFETKIISTLTKNFFEYFEKGCKKVPNSKIEANLLVETYRYTQILYCMKQNFSFRILIS